jgi:hypothetical protein
MTSCPDCGSENREGARFCNACGGRMEAEIAGAGAQPILMPVEDQDPAFSSSSDEGAVDSMFSGDESVPDTTGEPEPEVGATEPEAIEPEAEGSADSVEAEEDETTDEPPVQTPKTGYLVFPDETEQPIPPSQWLIGRADVSKFLPDPDKANEISRGHLTVFQEGEKFFIEDGKTMVQRKASTNKTWLVRGNDRILVTGTGRNELQDADEIDIAELVKLQFVMR